MGRGASGARRPRRSPRSSSSRSWPPARSSGSPYLVYRREGSPWIPGALALLAVLALLYAWRFGLHPRLVADDDGVHVRNPFSSRSFAWRDIRLVAPGENGLVIGSDDEVAEAWCVQKSNAVDRPGAVHPGRRRRPRPHRRARAARPAARGPRDRAAHPPRAPGRGPPADPHRAGRERGAPRAPVPARGVPLPGPRGHDAAGAGCCTTRPPASSCSCARGRRRGARPRRLRRRRRCCTSPSCRTAPGSATARHSWSSPFVRSTTAASPRGGLGAGGRRGRAGLLPPSRLDRDRAAATVPLPAAPRGAPHGQAGPQQAAPGRVSAPAPPTTSARPAWDSTPVRRRRPSVGRRGRRSSCWCRRVAATLLRVLAPTDDTGRDARLVRAVRAAHLRPRARAAARRARPGATARAALVVLTVVVAAADRAARQLAGAVLRARPPARSSDRPSPSTRRTSTSARPTPPGSPRSPRRADVVVLSETTRPFLRPPADPGLGRALPVRGRRPVRAAERHHGLLPLPADRRAPARRVVVDRSG